MSTNLLKTGFIQRDIGSRNIFFDFFNYSGIHRPVRLYTTPLSYVSDVTVKTTIEGTDGIVSYEIETAGASSEQPVHVVIRDEQGEVVAHGEGQKGKNYY